jgi:hemerythrin-like domain-containing protein
MAFLKVSCVKLISEHGQYPEFMEALQRTVETFSGSNRVVKRLWKSTLSYRWHLANHIKRHERC